MTFGFVWRWLAAPLLAPGPYRCEARRCGLFVQGETNASRFCRFHLAAFRAAIGYPAAQAEMSGFRPRLRRRLERWAAREVKVEPVSLVRAGYEEDEFESRGGIVVEGAK